MKFENTYAQCFPQLAAPAAPDIPADARVTWVNEPLAAQLGLDPDFLRSDAGLAWLTGSASDSAETHALAYSGYQFGHLSPALGDGRAHLLGELPSPGAEPGASSSNLAHRVDLHLKGSGLTPFSRPGSDGKAPLSAVWREVVIGESLHALGVNTSRALAVIETGERIRRRAPQPEPAGIVVRCASSHLRVGTFQYAHLNCDSEIRQQLVEYALKRHYPQLTISDNPAENALTLLRVVAGSQAQLVTQWMSLGFVHGVLNTDNVAISGESIDFGPCAFIDAFSRDAVYSSIDANGRYRYRNQPGITQWNLARCAESLLDLIDENPNRAIERATEILAEFEDDYQHAHTLAFAAKLGIALDEDAPAYLIDETAAFIEHTLNLLEQNSLDFTGFFRALTEEKDPFASVEDAPGGEENLAQISSWKADLTELRASSKTSPERARQLMQSSNPVYIPRNLALEATLRQVEAGNTQPLENLLAAVRQPYTRVHGVNPQATELESAPPQPRFFRSFCGT